MLRFSARKALRDFELHLGLEVPAGSCTALAGPSGAGKTTILQLVAGLVRPDEGQVQCGTSVWLDTSAGVELATEARGCGYLFQSYALFPNLSALDNVAYGIDGSRAIRRTRAGELLDRFGVGDLATAKPGQLSGGERQRVALARALGREPQVLLLDEPLSALDSTTRGKASRALSEAIKSAAVPTLLVTHDFQEAATFGDQVAIIDRGQVVQRGTPGELADAPANGFVADFTGAVVVEGDVEGSNEGLTLVRLRGGDVIRSTDSAEGAVTISIHPWELAIEPPGSGTEGSALNRLDARVATVTVVGNRARVGLDAGQHLTAEITRASAERLALAPGDQVDATWKATATRLISR